MNNEEIARRLANSYSSYIQMDNEKEMNALEESIEDTLTRLEELENLIKMMQAEREKFNSCDITAARAGLNALCQRVNKLDEMSKRVLEDVEALETVVDKAEADLIGSTEGKLKSMLKPLGLFHKQEAASSSVANSTPAFIPYTGFESSSFFPKQSEEESSPSSGSQY